MMERGEHRQPARELDGLSQYRLPSKELVQGAEAPDLGSSRLSSEPSTGPRLSQHSVFFVGSGAGGLGQRVAAELRAVLGRLILEQFPNSETRVEVHEAVRNRHAFVLMEMSAPVNEVVMQTALLVQALKLAGAARISVLQFDD